MGSTPRSTGDRAQDCSRGHDVNRYDPTGPIFISYRQSDGIELAERLDRFLRAGGLIPWRDLVDLPPGETARRVREAFAEGISSAVLIVTPEIGESEFVRDRELPALLEEERKPNDFSLLVLNTIGSEEELAQNRRGVSRPGSRKRLDFDAPDRKLRTRDQPLRDLKQYSVDEFGQLYRELLHLRLKHLAGPTASCVPVDLSSEVITTLRSVAECLFGQEQPSTRSARHPGIGDGEITIQTQTRPLPDAHTRRSGTTRLNREHDLAIRLRQDPVTGIPAVQDYRYLKDTLPIMVDALYAYGVGQATLTGGGHFSLGWALGAALPVTRQGGLCVIDLSGCEWTDTGHDGDQKTFRAVPENIIKGDQQDLDRLRRVAVWIRNSNEQNTQAFEELATTCDDSIQIIIRNDDGKRDYPSNEGARLAREIASKLREHGAGKELHIAWSAATSLAPLVARRTNTLNCVLYELTQNPFATMQRYQKVLRVVAGTPRGPIVEVFDDRDTPYEPPTALVNLTPHVVRLYRDDVVVKEWPAPDDGRWVRVGEERHSAPVVRQDDLDIPVTIIESGDLVDEPPKVPGVGYIVPRLSALAAKRRDFYFPLDEVRDENGSILGVKGLGQFPPKNGD